MILPKSSKIVKIVIFGGPDFEKWQKTPKIDFCPKSLLAHRGLFDPFFKNGQNGHFEHFRDPLVRPNLRFWHPSGFRALFWPFLKNLQKWHFLRFGEVRKPPKIDFWPLLDHFGVPFLSIPGSLHACMHLNIPVKPHIKYAYTISGIINKGWWGWGPRPWKRVKTRIP